MPEFQRLGDINSFRGAIVEEPQMIRRESTNSSSDWILIPQVEHAQLAAELADHWSDLAGGVGLGRQRRTLVEAIRRHDDGWRTWDERPAIDPESGIPLDFTERTAQESHQNLEGFDRVRQRLGALGYLGHC